MLERGLYFLKHCAVGWREYNKNSVEFYMRFKKYIRAPFTK